MGISLKFGGSFGKFPSKDCGLISPKFEGFCKIYISIWSWPSDRPIRRPSNSCRRGHPPGAGNALGLVGIDRLLYLETLDWLYLNWASSIIESTRWLVYISNTCSSWKVIGLFGLSSIYLIPLGSSNPSLLRSPAVPEGYISNVAKLKCVAQEWMILLMSISYLLVLVIHAPLCQQFSIILIC